MTDFRELNELINPAAVGDTCFDTEQAFNVGLEIGASW